MKKAFILLAAALFLSGCGLTKEDLGMAASKPDETQVTRRNQLVIPPDFDVRPQQQARSGKNVLAAKHQGGSIRAAVGLCFMLAGGNGGSQTDEPVALYAWQRAGSGSGREP